MTIKNTTLTKGFILAGLMNLSVLVFSKGFTNDIIPEFDPEVMSYFGLLMIMVWGLAYMAIAKTFHQVKWLVFVFALEKIIYVYIWVQWMLSNSVTDVYEKDILAGLFYSIYGINDLIFFIFFIFVFIRLLKSRTIEP